MLRAIEGPLGDLDELVRKIGKCEEDEEGENESCEIVSKKEKRERRSRRRERRVDSEDGRDNQVMESARSNPMKSKRSALASRGMSKLKRQSKPVEKQEEEVKKEDEEEDEVLIRARAIIEAARNLDFQLNLHSTIGNSESSNEDEGAALPSPDSLAGDLFSPKAASNEEWLSPEQNSEIASIIPKQQQPTIAPLEIQEQREEKLKKEDDDLEEDDELESAQPSDTGFESEVFMWVPLLTRGSVAKGSSTVFFQEPFIEILENGEETIPAVGSVLKLLEDEYRIVEVDSEGLRLKLEREVGENIKQKRLSSDGLFKVFIKLPLASVSFELKNRAMMCGSGKVHLDGEKSTSSQRRTASERRRQAIERTKMEKEDQQSREIMQNETSKRELEEKTKELQRKTKERLRDRLRQAKQEELQAQEKQRALEQEMEEKSRLAKVKAEEAAKESRKRVLQRKLQKAQDLEQKRKEEEAAMKRKLENEERERARLQLLCKQRVRKMQEKQREQQRISALTPNGLQPYVTGDSREETESPRNRHHRQQQQTYSGTEHDMRIETKRRHLEFARRAKLLKDAEEARYNRKPSSQRTRRTNFQRQPSNNQLDDTAIKRTHQQEISTKNLPPRTNKVFFRVVDEPSGPVDANVGNDTTSGSFVPVFQQSTPEQHTTNDFGPLLNATAPSLRAETSSEPRGWGQNGGSYLFH